MPDSRSALTAPAGLLASEPMDALLRAACDALGDAGRSLRARGWDATIEVDAADASQDHVADVSLRVRLGFAMRIPDEARRG